MRSHDASSTQSAAFKLAHTQAVHRFLCTYGVTLLNRQKCDARLSSICATCHCTLCFASLCLKYDELRLKASRAPHLKKKKKCDSLTLRYSHRQRRDFELVVPSSKASYWSSYSRNLISLSEWDIRDLGFVVTHLNPTTRLGFTPTDDWGTLIWIPRRKRREERVGDKRKTEGQRRASGLTDTCTNTRDADAMMAKPQDRNQSRIKISTVFVMLMACRNHYSAERRWLPIKGWGSQPNLAVGGQASPMMPLAASNDEEDWQRCGSGRGERERGGDYI